MSTVRRDFALTYIFALLTGVFWICQFIFPVYGWTLFAPVVGLLSLVARVSFITSFIRSSSNWLAVSAISSTSSLALSIIGGIPFGTPIVQGWPETITMIFSVATLVTYFIQARRAGLRPYVIERRPNGS